MQFDKDDDLIMKFVASASNLRSHCYGIALQSLFQIKGMAGNIIHAIATTNAIVSGLIVVQAMKILAGDGDISQCHAGFVQQYPSNRKLIMPVNCEPPNTDCHACAVIPLHLQINVNQTTFSEFLEQVVKGEWKFSDFSLDNGSEFMYDEGDAVSPDELAANQKHLSTILSKLPGGGIVHNTMLNILDDNSSLCLPVLITHSEEPGYKISGDFEIAKKQATRKDEEKKKKMEEEIKPIDIEDDDISIVDDTDLKRKRDADEPNDQTKKSKVAASEPDVIS